MAGKQITNEAIISALLLHGKVKDAAEALKCSPRTISDRMRESDFRSDYLEARSGMIREAAVTINAKLGKAISTVEEIMLDADNNPAVRLQAAQTIINNAGKFTERLTAAETAEISYNDNKPLFELDFSRMGSMMRDD